MAQSVLNGSALQRYGQVTALRLDSQEKSLEITLELKGEREPLKIKLEGYELVQELAVSYLVVRRIATSREWLTGLANNFAAGRRFKLPPESAALIAQCL